MAKTWRIAAITLTVAAAVLTHTGVGSAQRRSNTRSGSTTGGCGIKDIGSCPDFGCGKTEPDKLLNQRKRTFPTSAAAAALSLDDFDALQQAADRLFALKHVPKADLREVTAQERDLLRNLKVSQGHVSEGDFVQLAGL